VIQGVNGVPAAELLGSANADRLIKRLDHVLGISAAQWFNIYARRSVPSKSTTPSSFPVYNATIVTSSTRLVQSQASTRIVQVLLSVMVFFAIIAFVKQRTRHVLPKNPCSIAAMGSLLAGSELLGAENLPPGSQVGDDAGIRKRLNGMVFSMGWWERDGKIRFCIDIGQYDAKDLEDLEIEDKERADVEEGEASVVVG
jgi:hypothetical protein